MNRYDNLISKNRENTLFYTFEDIVRESDKKENVYFGLKSSYEDLGKKETNCIPIAHYYDKNGKLQVVFSREPSHCLGIGCTGAGKTTSLIIPKVNILSSLKNKPSFFIIDVKGELHDNLSGHLKKNGYDIKVLDLNDPEFSDSWNPLLDLYDKYVSAYELTKKVIPHKDDINNYPNLMKLSFNKKAKKWYEFMGVAYSDIKSLNKGIAHKRERLLADVSEEICDLAYMFIVTQKLDDPHWDDTARDLFSGVILAMLERTVFGRGEKLTRDQFNLKNIINILLSTQEIYLKSFINNSDPKGEAYRFANKIVNMEAEKTKSCYFGVLSTQLSTFKSYAIQKLTIKNSIDLTTIADKPEAIFLKMDDLKESNFKLAQLIILRLYQQLKAKAQTLPRRTLSRPVHFILDEFGNFPKFNNFGNMISVSRSYNIWYTMVIQSYSQLNIKYGKELSDVIIENSNMRMFFGTNDYMTKKNFSESCGKISKISESAYLYGNSSDLVNCPIEEYPAVTVSDLSKVETSEVYITCFRMPTMKSRLERYYLVKEFDPLPVVEYRQIDDIEINSNKYTYDISKERQSYRKVEVELEYVDKPDEDDESDDLTNVTEEESKQLSDDEIFKSLFGSTPVNIGKKKTKAKVEEKEEYDTFMEELTFSLLERKGAEVKDVQKYSLNASKYFPKEVMKGITEYSNKGMAFTTDLSLTNLESYVKKFREHMFKTFIINNKGVSVPELKVLFENVINSLYPYVRNVFSGIFATRFYYFKVNFSEEAEVLVKKYS